MHVYRYIYILWAFQLWALVHVAVFQYFEIGNMRVEKLYFSRFCSLIRWDEEDLYG